MSSIKRILYLIVFVVVLSVSTNVMAAETLPIKSVDFCGVTKVAPTSTTMNVKVTKPGNDCAISVELINDSYSLYNFNKNIQFTREGTNNHNIYVKDINGNITHYSFIVNFTNTGSIQSSQTSTDSNQENPSTGDNQVLYLVLALISCSVIAISYNRIVKYAKED